TLHDLQNSGVSIGDVELANAQLSCAAGLVWKRIVDLHHWPIRPQGLIHKLHVRVDILGGLLAKPIEWCSWPQRIIARAARARNMHIAGIVGHLLHTGMPRRMRSPAAKEGLASATVKAMKAIAAVMAVSAGRPTKLSDSLMASNDS